MKVSGKLKREFRATVFDVCGESWRNEVGTLLEINKISAMQWYVHCVGQDPTDLQALNLPLPHDEVIQKGPSNLPQPVLTCADALAWLRARLRSSTRVWSLVLGLPNSTIFSEFQKRQKEKGLRRENENKQPLSWRWSSSSPFYLHSLSSLFKFIVCKISICKMKMKLHKRANQGLLTVHCTALNWD